MGVWRARVEGRLAWVIVSLRPALVPASRRWGHPAGWPVGARRGTSVHLFEQSGEAYINEQTNPEMSEGIARCPKEFSVRSGVSEDAQGGPCGEDDRAHAQAA